MASTKKRKLCGSEKLETELNKLKHCEEQQPTDTKPLDNTKVTNTTRSKKVRNIDDSRTKRQDAQDEKGGRSDPFKSFNISNFELMLSEKRQLCPTCGKSRKYYCCFCKTRLSGHLPIVKLPVPVDIIHHKQEKLKKSTGVHGCVLSNDVEMYDFPEIREYDPNTTVLLYPCKDSIPVSEIPMHKCKKLVVIDCTWFQAPQMLRAKGLANLPRVHLKAHKTLFWRYQTNVSDEHLATIEAIYYFEREYWNHVNGEYKGELDDLLFLFASQYKVVRRRYDESPHLISEKMEKFMESE